MRAFCLTLLVVLVAGCFGRFCGGPQPPPTPAAVNVHAHVQYVPTR